ncbi:chloramphenicol-sensitive protein RarD [Caldalkalibacillus uzonensis]|uniref:Chloramphenicol-sensitive protein RarD n=1 Tax=Caldalkalibacillus uzonensis TaxID=353224 RepID=A0ABU0CN08_9BACI|nr:EamA family transporter RarD [Caldalkalibacillus uzonensis]MDQ0337473.1 chloramphenicol-sensitive protein RarD [Caldalkalibacillus uzonensis]
MENQKQVIIGAWYAIAAYAAWGLLPLYWKLLENIPALEILAHRIIWSFVFVALILAVSSKWPQLKKECLSICRNRKQSLALMSSAVVISANWLIYIWAVNNDRVIETSLGYYINPLFSVLLGIVVLKERLTFWQSWSFVLATIGVLIITVKYGTIPWIALSLALSFALYGLAKKIANLNAMIGLAFETLLTLPVALLYVALLHNAGNSSFGASSVSTSLLLAGAGMATALPLLWFAQGARKIPLSMLGFFQYIAPSITLCLGIFVFNEPFSKIHLISFMFIWSALTLYSLSKTKLMVQLETKLNRKKSFGA